MTLALGKNMTTSLRKMLLTAMVSLASCLATSLATSLALSLTLALPFTGSAQAREGEKLTIQKAAEERVMYIIRGYDPDALVFVEIRSKTQDGEKLPSTPFVVDKLALPDGSGSTEVDSLVVTIVSKKPKLPKKVDSLIREAMKQFSENIELKVKSLPSELIPDSGKDKEKSAEDEAKKKEAEESKKRLEDEKKNPLAGTERLIGEVRDAVSKLGTSVESASGVLKGALGNLDGEKVKKLSAFALGGLGLYLLILFLLSALFSSRRSRSMETTLSSSVKEAADKIASVFKEGSEGSGKDSEGGSGSAQIGGMLDGTLAQEDGHGGVSAMEDKSIVAMLSDCYWSRLDGYAALLWRKIPMGRRATLLSLEPRLKEYVSYLGSATNLAVVNLQAEHNPYYLSPFAISHLDNEALTQAARTIPGLLSQLPTLRTDAMVIPARERLGLLAQSLSEGEEAAAQASLAALPASKARHLEKTVMIPIDSLLEEEAILADSAGYSLDKKRSLRTLGWLAQLPKERGAAILKPYSAKALAGIWVAPAATLETLASFIPTEKRELLLSYLEQASPTRDSALYRALHESSVRALAELEKEEAVRGFKDTANTQDLGPGEPAEKEPQAD